MRLLCVCVCLLGQTAAVAVIGAMSPADAGETRTTRQQRLANNFLFISLESESETRLAHLTTCDALQTFFFLLCCTMLCKR